MGKRAEITIDVLGADGWVPLRWIADVDPSDSAAVAEEVNRRTSAYMESRTGAPYSGYRHNLATCARPAPEDSQGE